MAKKAVKPAPQQDQKGLEEALTMPVDKRKTGRRKKKGKLTEKQIKAK